MLQVEKSQPSSREEILGRPHWYKALTLTERLALLREQRGKHTSGSFDRGRATRRLQAWKEQQPFEKESFFADRLAMDAINEEELLALLGDASEAAHIPADEIPAWLHSFAQVFARPEDTAQEPVDPPYKTSLLYAVHPLIIHGMQRLQEGIKKIVACSTFLPFNQQSVHRLLLKSLCDRLVQQVSRTLTLELNVARLENRLVGEKPEERFQHFIEQLSCQEGILSIFAEYAPLARILVETVENWVQVNLECLERLCADWQVICQTLAPEHDLGELTEVNAGVGDQHKGGRSTMKLTFSSGFQLMYKPRSLAIDVHFQQLLRWLNERGDHPTFYPIRIIDRGTYGWAEFITAQPCSSTEEVERFYERQGAYIALFYALEATDVHFENLIAHGEHPIMIDLESLFHPRLTGTWSQTAQSIAIETLNSSVTRIGLLPQRVWGNIARAGVDISGLGGKSGQVTPQPVLQVEAIGTDQMRFIRQYVELGSQHNRPVLNGKDVDVLDYKKQLLTGFRKLYRLLLSQRENLLSGPIAQFAQDETRFILRATRIYGQLLYESYHPDFLRDMLDRESFFDRLWVSVQYIPLLKRVIAAERADLHAGDIPIFTTRPDTRDIYTSRGECINSFLSCSGLELVKQRLYRFSERDLTKQCWFIEASLTTLSLENGHISYRNAQLKPVEAAVTREQLIQAACAVGDRLYELSLEGEHGANWIGLVFFNEREWSLLPTASDLYNGTGGIALFLAYLGEVTAEEKYTRLARSALRSVREQAREIRETLTGIGGFDGWGAIIYLYTHLGTLWRDVELLEEAQKLVRVISEQVEKDSTLDVMGGTAGGLACLLALYDVMPSPETLAAAIQCGDHLLASAPQCGGTPQENVEKRSMTQLATRPLTGFSHGAAGMALYLLKLAAISGMDRFSQGAVSAMKYERSVFSPKDQNWPDFRDRELLGSVFANVPESEAAYMVTWCHGAPGIGLGRLASLQYIDDAAIREEIDSALHTTLERGFTLNHSLCHGVLGNLETLLTAAQVLQDQQYYEHVEYLTSMILANITSRGWLTGIPMGIESPGLMVGIAGIGYQLLRLAEPKKVPPILLLAPPVTEKASQTGAIGGVADHCTQLTRSPGSSA